MSAILNTEGGPCHSSALILCKIAISAIVVLKVYATSSYDDVHRIGGQSCVDSRAELSNNGRLGVERLVYVSGRSLRRC
jgi:hypothetical protein